MGSTLILYLLISVIPAELSTRVKLSSEASVPAHPSSTPLEDSPPLQAVAVAARLFVWREAAGWTHSRACHA